MNGKYKDKKRGDRVEYMAYAGRGLSGPEYKRASAKVALVFRDYLVADAGGRHGRPVVVNDGNFVR